MERPPPSPDLNPIENLWSILKKKKTMRVAESWTSELQLWGGCSSREIQAGRVHKLSSSMDRRNAKGFSNMSPPGELARLDLFFCALV